MSLKKTTKPHSDLYIAAVGSSAGGLEALQKLISHIPDDIKNIAFIIVQHLSPSYKSMLVQTLSSQTKLQVIEAKDGVEVQRCGIYITPPDHEISIKNGKLHLLKSVRNFSPHPSIDGLFNSLAVEYNAKAIGIILSGTGSDGADGVRAIKHAGGIIMVQTPRSAKYDSMPQAAIETGKVDFILTAEKIAGQVALITGNNQNKQTAYTAENAQSRGYDEIIELLSKETGTDFSNYKLKTLYRRIDKRMAELKLNSTGKYIKYIEKNQTEIEQLFHNVLIGVTSFFREPIVFKALEKHLSALIDSKENNTPLRVWIPGCATGEEAYTVAIIIAGLLNKKKRTLPVQIFGTDINEHALSFARKAVYTNKTLKHVPADKLKEYFVQHNDFAEVSKSLRSMVLFSRHDLTHNPPFLKLDLIVCRNLLIYFNSKLQDYIFPVFFSALATHGILLLGKSEGIGHFTDLFTPLNRESKIFQRKAGASLHNIRYTPIRTKEVFKQKAPYELSITEMVKETIYKVFAHPYVVINDNADIKEINGNVGRYLSLQQGQMNANLFKMAHDDLKIELRSLVNKAIKEDKEIKSASRKLLTDGKEYKVSITIRPLLYSESPNKFYMVVFEEVKSETIGNAQPAIKESNGNITRIKELELELDATREDLQSFVERLENTNSEFQTVNEELQSSNEELKISNEELETANEELQSTNEEINIAYSELKAANIALEKQDTLLQQAEINTQALLNNNMQSFILIDDLYKIIAFNQLALKTFKEISTVKLVEGTDFRKLLSSKELTAFENDFKSALKGKVVEAERTIFNGTGKAKTFLLNFTPVSDSSRQARRISFGMLDITKQKNAEREIEQLSWVASHSNNLVIITDKNRKIEWVNHAFEKLTGYKLNQVKGKIPGDVLMGANSDTNAAAKIRKTLKNHESSTGEIILCYTKAGKEIWLSADAIPIVRDGKVVNFVSVMTDLTDLMASNEIKDKQKTILQKQKLFDAIAQYFPNGILGVINKDLKYEFVGGTELKKLGLSHKHLIGDRIFDKIHSKSTEIATPFLQKAFSNETISFEVSVKDSLYQVIAIPINNFPEPITQAVVVILNITQAKRTEAELTKALTRQKELIDMKSKFVTIASHEFRTPLSTILSSTFLVGKYNKPEDVQNRQKHLDRIKNSVTNLTDILNDFLALGQIDEGTIKNRPVLFNIQTFFTELIDEIQAYLKPGQKLIFTHTGHSDMVCLDKQHFKNVFINLLSNAIKYSGENKPILVHSDYSKKYLKVSVKDEGIGIPKEDQKNLFQTFFRGNNVSNIQGTGMGLHIIQKYLEIMGGNIHFTSKMDVGSTFTVKIPQTSAEALKS